MPNRNIENLDSLFDEFTVIRCKKAAEEAKKKQIRNGNCKTQQRVGNCEVADKNRKLDAAEEAKKHNRVTREQGLMIQNARNKKGWSQKYLANQIGEKSDVITQYENGKAILNNKIITKLERKLNIKLRNKK